MKQYLHGIHEPGLEYLFGAKPGWILHLTNFSVGQVAKDYSIYHPHKNIIRLQWGYGNAGTIPEKGLYLEYIRRIQQFVRNSKGVDYIVIGNEINLAWEWPNNTPISLGDYTKFYLEAYAAIKQVNPDIKVAPQPPGPWNDSLKYPGNERGDWVQQLSDELILIGPNKVDWICIHTYTHGYNTELVYSDNKMENPFTDRHFDFKTYIDFVNVLPEQFNGLPIIITETNGNDSWPNNSESISWINGIYGEINWWNNQKNVQPINGVLLYRTPNNDRFGFIDNTFVHTGISQVVDKGYFTDMSSTDEWAGWTTANLNMREEPNSKSNKIATIPNGEQVVVKHEAANSPGWLFVTYNDFSGFVFGRYVTDETPNKNEPSEDCDTCEAIYICTTTTKLNLRSAPSISNNIIIMLDAGILLAVHKELGDWLYVSTNDKTGYVAKEYTKKIEAIPISNERGDDRLQTIIGTTTTNLNLRNKAIVKNSIILTVIPMHKNIIILRNLGDWLFVNYNTYVGWVNSKYVVINTTNDADNISFSWPTEYRVITQKFGERPEYYSKFGLLGHEGIDFRAPLNSNIYAVDDGIVISTATTNAAYGNYIKIKHTYGETIYAHMGSFFVSTGKQVKAGQPIGTSGNTGNSSAAHLHLGFRPNSPNYSNGYYGYIDFEEYLF